MKQYSVFHEEEVKSKMKKAAVGNLFLPSSVNLVAAQLISSVILSVVFFLLLTTYWFLLFVFYLSLLPSLLCLLNCLSLGYVPLRIEENASSHLPITCSLICIIFNGRVSIWPSKYRIVFFWETYTLKSTWGEKRGKNGCLNISVIYTSCLKKKVPWSTKSLFEL